MQSILEFFYSCHQLQYMTGSVPLCKRKSAEIAILHMSYVAGDVLAVVLLVAMDSLFMVVCNKKHKQNNGTHYNQEIRVIECL